MTTGQKALVLVLSGLGVGIGSYFLFRKSDTQLKREILSKTSNKDKSGMLAVINQMSRQELLDTAQVLQYNENTPKSTFEKIDPLLKARVAAIIDKYKIFT